MAAIGLATMMLLGCGALMVTGYLTTEAADTSAKVAAQQRDLQQAYDAVMGFAAVHGRLPCHATARNGTEDCADLSGKGWLPVSTLEGFASSPSGLRDHLDMHYGVFRGSEATASDPDLAVRSDATTPLLASGVAPKGYPSGGTSIVSELDLCAKLRSLAPSTLTNRVAVANTAPAFADNRLQVQGGTLGTGRVNAAFAISAAARGAPLSASGANGDTTSFQFESPARSTNTLYSDQVKVGEASELHALLGCSGVTASLDMLAVASGWPGDAAGQKEGNAKTREINVVANAIGIASGSLIVGSSAISVKNALSTEGRAHLNLAAALLDPLQWPLIPRRIYDVVSTTKGLARALAELSLNTAWVASDAIYLGSVVVMFDEAARTPVWQGAGPMVTDADKESSKNE